MVEGWSQNFADENLQWQPLPMDNRPFEVKLNNGLVSNAKS
jgi:hypothetical protein